MKREKQPAMIITIAEGLDGAPRRQLSRRSGFAYYILDSPRALYCHENKIESGKKKKKIKT